jgi:hypothetical protein
MEHRIIDPSSLWGKKKTVTFCALGPRDAVYNDKEEPLVMRCDTQLCPFFQTWKLLAAKK